jgi:hypothetical protein
VHDADAVEVQEWGCHYLWWWWWCWLNWCWSCVLVLVLMARHGISDPDDITGGKGWAVEVSETLNETLHLEQHASLELSLGHRDLESEYPHLNEGIHVKLAVTKTKTCKVLNTPSLGDGAEQ